VSLSIWSTGLFVFVLLSPLAAMARGDFFTNLIFLQAFTFPSLHLHTNKKCLLIYSK